MQRCSRGDCRALNPFFLLTIMKTELDSLLEELYGADDHDYFDLDLANDIVARFPAEAEAWAARARIHYKLDEPPG